MKIIKRIESVEYVDNYYLFKTNACDIRMYFLTSNIIRIRVGFDGDFAEESYSLVNTAWTDRLDKVMGNERRRIDVIDSQLCDEADAITITSKQLTVVVRKDPAVIEVYDLWDNLLHRDIPDLAYRQDSNNRRFHTQEIMEGDSFYGFGEKTGPLDKSGTLMTMSPNDTMGYDPNSSDSLYKHIPFYIKVNKNNHMSCGYFYHNMNECTFDMGRSHSNYWKHHSTYQVDGGDIDLFFIAGPTIKDVVKGYTFLTGRSAFLPKYSLGYLGSSMYYSELSADCDDKILKFIDTATKEGIPIDGFQLSSGYTTQDTSEGEKRCVFTWNKARFKNPKKFFKEATKRGITVSPNVKPGILLSHPNIREFTSRDMLVGRSSEALYDSVDNNSYATGTWWGGEGVFADFTNPTCREEWKKMLKANVIDYGTSSIWNDNCEYDSIVDKDSTVDFDGKGSTIGATRVIQSNLMCKITDEAIRETNPNVRPFIVCRAGHSGIQRYAQSWAGDNKTCWEALKGNVTTILGMSMCGVSNYGCDVGGFYGPSPSPELLVRWVQNGIFMPRFSIHSVNTDNTVTEPWMYPSYTQYIRDAIQFRYRLFPYLYSLSMRSSEQGDMILSPIFAAYPEDEVAYNDNENFLLGKSLLVGNVLDNGATKKSLYLPDGSNYYGIDYRRFLTTDSSSHNKITQYSCGRTVDIDVQLGDIPLLLTSGAILPVAMNQMMNLTKESVTGIHTMFVADADGSFTYYEDDGISNDYTKGMYHKLYMDMKSGVTTTLFFSHEGSYTSTLRDMELEVISNNNCPLSVENSLTGSIEQFLYKSDFDAATIGWYYDIENKVTLIKYPYIDKDYSINISYENFDMLGM